VIVCSISCKENWHRYLDTLPVVSLSTEINKINISEVEIILGAPKTKRLIVSFIIPKLWWVCVEQSRLHCLELLFPDQVMPLFSQRTHHNANEDINISLDLCPLHLFIDFTNYLNEGISIFLCQCCSWEVFGYDPRIPDAVVTNQIHSICMMEDFFVSQIKAFSCWRINASCCLIMVFPF